MKKIITTLVPITLIFSAHLYGQNAPSCLEVAIYKSCDTYLRTRTEIHSLATCGRIEGIKYPRCSQTSSGGDFLLLCNVYCPLIPACAYHACASNPSSLHISALACGLCLYCDLIAKPWIDVWCTDSYHDNLQDNPHLLRMKR